MQYYMLKTHHNPFSPVFADMVAMFQLEETVIDEAFNASADHLRHLGVQTIPSLIAVAEINGRQRLIHECSAPAALPTFLSQATEKLAALEA